MSLDADPRPIFIVGSPRSGTSILTWCVGQHPNVLATEETGWMGPIAHSAAVAHAIGGARGQRSQLSAMGVSRDELIRTFGTTINDLVMAHRDRVKQAAADGEADHSGDEAFRLARSTDPKGRWVDGTPENSFYIYELSLLFPNALFIHLVRDPQSVVRSLTYFHTIGGAHFTADSACHEWLLNVRDCLRAERALGSSRVHRITYDHLVTNPEATMAELLEFVGEPFTTDCVEPLATRINSSAVPDDVKPVEPAHALQAEAEALAAIACDVTTTYEADPVERAGLERRFHNRSFGPGLSLTQKNLMRHTMPRDALVLVASGGDQAFLKLEGRTGWHFPQSHAGEHVPVSSLSDDQLLSELERLRAAGAQFLLVPAGVGDPLSHRAAVIEYLSKWYPRLADENGVAAIWGLAVAGAGPPTLSHAEDAGAAAG